MALYKHVSTFVDAICMTRPITPVEHKFLYGQMHFMNEKESKDHVVPGGWTKLKAESYLLRLSIHLPKVGQIASLLVGSIKGGYRYLTIGIRPSRMGSSDLLHFMETTDALLPSLGYSSAYCQWRVSYLEVAIDQLSVPMHSFVPYRLRCLTSHIHVDGKGAKGTLTLGSPSSAFRFRAYDKHRHLLETGKPVLYPMQTRMEIALRSLGMPAPLLAAKLPNPFSRVGIADLKVARNLSSNSHWQQFLDHCLVAGSADALGKCSTYDRKKFIGMLRASEAGWWMPGAAWSSFPKAMSRIAPL